MFSELPQIADIGQRRQPPLAEVIPAYQRFSRSYTARYRSSHVIQWITWAERTHAVIRMANAILRERPTGTPRPRTFVRRGRFLGSRVAATVYTKRNCLGATRHFRSWGQTGPTINLATIAPLTRSGHSAFRSESTALGAASNDKVHCPPPAWERFCLLLPGATRP
jgi:hypothetical protein